MTELKPIQLRCEYLVNPPGIDCPQPRLSWILESSQRGHDQGSYRIIVASGEQLLREERGDIWDSGRVESSQSSQILYQGVPLVSSRRYWWKVQVWDGRGDGPISSEDAWWGTALLHKQDWQGEWIGLEGETSQEDANLQPGVYFRKVHKLSKPVRYAHIYATARGVYELHVNGQRVNGAVLSPGWTDYNKRIQYQSYDVSAFLRSGENVLGAIVGTGWYCGYVGFGQNARYYGDRVQLLLQLRLEYTDGSSETIATDASWQASTGPILYSDLQQGEYYDARQEIAGWDLPDFSAHSWYPVQSEARNQVSLVADMAEPILITGELVAQTCKLVAADTWIVDMGQNMVGWVRLQVAGEAGTRVQLRFAEMLNPDGTLYTTNLRSARQTDTYILKGSEKGSEAEVFEPHFTFHGFRYIEVTGYPGELFPAALVGRVVHSATSPTGSFDCSHELVNQLYRNIVWGQRGNFLSVPTDCPQRDERLGWLGDAQIFIRTASYTMDVAAFFSKWMIDVEDGQSQNGAFPDIAPCMPKQTVLGEAAPAWGEAGIIVPWTLYQVYGDTRVIERHYSAMVRWIDYVYEANPGYLRTQRLNNNYGDWLSIEAETSKELLATAYFAYSVRLLSQMARAIGRQEDAQRYEQLFQAIRDAFVVAYVTPDGKIQGETQTSYLLALFMDLLPEGVRQKAIERLVAAIEQKNWHLSTGFVGVGYLCPVLSEAGYNDVAYRLLLNETFPSWGYSIRHGATTIWERWDGWTEEKGFQDPGMNSFNHYSLGSVGQWLFQYVAGIDTDAERPGYQRIQIRPYPDSALSFVRAEYHSIHGKIGSHWQKLENRFILKVTIPANTTAIVALPASRTARVFEEDAPVEQAEGVRYLSQEGERRLFQVASGVYTFTVEEASAS